ncbi:MAG: hypothetical protein R2942_11760 [Ignavibacteria bacterium]
MNTNKSASLEAKLVNSKDLLTSVKDLSKYNPSSEVIKIDNYENFINETDGAVTQYKSASGYLQNATMNANAAFEKLVKISRDIRSEIQELKGASSEEAEAVNSIVILITGENVQKHSKMKKKTLKGLKDGEDPPQFSSVSALDHESRLGNFRTLLGLLKTFEFYEPLDAEITISSLEAFENELKERLDDIAEKEIAYTNQRSRVMNYFNGEHGLKDRAVRAKKHVKRKYGVKSPEYKLLTNKKY